VRSRGSGRVFLGGLGSEALRRCKWTWITCYFRLLILFCSYCFACTILLVLFYLVHLVYLVHSVYSVHLVHLVHSVHSVHLVYLDRRGQILHDPQTTLVTQYEIVRGTCTKISQ
jgi:hypothetical protein